MSILYFAYDEKMFSPILANIAPNALYRGVAQLPGYKLFFHHHSAQDSSGKANIVPTKEKTAVVYGVLYEISEADKIALEKELKIGKTNQEIALKVLPVSPVNQSAQRAITFVACKEYVYEDLVPYSWYKEMLIQSALAHQLPKTYIHALERSACAQDPNLSRDLHRKRFLHSCFL